MNRADLVTVTSQKLFDLRHSQNKNIHVVMNGGDVKLYQTPPNAVDTLEASAALNDIPHPIIGSVGALDAYKLDFDMLYQVAKNNLAWHFVFIGAPVVDRKSRELDELVKLDNVHLVGAVPRQKVPAYINSFDVCVIPYRASQYNAASFPLKFWELVATGKPVVVSGLPELKAYKSVSSYVSNADEMNTAIKQAISNNSGSDGRKEVARSHSYEDRLAKLLSLLSEVISFKNNK